MGRGLALPAMLGALALLASCAEEDVADPSSTATRPASSATPSPTSASLTPTATPALDQYGCEAGPDGEKCRLLATHTPVPAPTPAPPAAAHPKGARTGVLEVDALIDAIEREDAETLAQLVNFLSYPCHARVPTAGSRQPLVCAAGRSEGDPLVGIWAVEVEGGLWPLSRDGDREALIPLFRQMLDDHSLSLHAVFQPAGTEPQFQHLRPDYLVTFAWWHLQAGPRFDAFQLRDGGLIAIEFANPITPAWDNPDDPGWLLPRAR